MSESPSTPSATPRTRSRTGRFLFIILIILVLPPALAATVIFAPGPLGDPKSVVVPYGSRVYNIADLLDESGVTFNPVIFIIATKFMASNGLKAGEYQFTPHESTADVVRMMRDGHSVVRMFTAAEGLSSAEIAELLKDNPVLVGAITIPPQEGSLLPQTYRYNYGDGRAALIARMQKAMQETLNALWDKRDANLPLQSPEDAVIMASIIEKETAKPEERARIARVFYNRLQQGMRLQSDPTVIYGLTRGKEPLNRSLTRDDLISVSPYNTYMHDGLPPGPICNPGRASIEAVLHPEANDYLYFVADGDGGHVFAKDLAEHNQNVAKWNALKAKQ